MGIVLQWFIGIPALLVLLPYLDRLRSMSWRTHLPAVVGMHLLLALWLGAVAYEALVFGTAPWWHVLGISGAGTWICVSWETWRAGPPVHTESGPMPLGSR